MMPHALSVHILSLVPRLLPSFLYILYSMQQKLGRSLGTRLHILQLDSDGAINFVTSETILRVELSVHDVAYFLQLQL